MWRRHKMFQHGLCARPAHGVFIINGSVYVTRKPVAALKQRQPRSRAAERTSYINYIASTRTVSPDGSPGVAFAERYRIDEERINRTRRVAADDRHAVRFSISQHPIK